MNLRIGITMRITNADHYFELRDAIAMDWSRYLMKAFPDSKFIYVPNIGSEVVDYIKKWDINTLIFSGGDDIGAAPERDTTEFELLRYAINTKIPIIAICRGLQLVQTYFGGRVCKGDDTFVKNHKDKSHQLLYNNSIVEVNSYHTNMIDEKTLDANFDIFARCTVDNSIEGIRSDTILAMMWHPERDIDVSDWNKELIQSFLIMQYD